MSDPTHTTPTSSVEDGVNGRGDQLNHTPINLRHPISHPAWAGYVVLPVLAFLFWMADLIGLLCLWTLRDHSVQYRPGEAMIVFISDVGAAHKALFIPGNATTAVFYSLSLISERYLRHTDRIPGTIRHRTRNWDIVAVIFGILGGIALIIVSIFDAFNHSKIHWTFALIFIVCIAVSAASQSAEIAGLKKDHPDRDHLRRNSMLKMAVVIVAIVVAIAFAVMYGVCQGGDGLARPHCETISSASAVCEWVIAFLFGFYLLTFVLDLWPAHKASHRYMRRHEKLLEKQRTGQNSLLAENGGVQPRKMVQIV